MHRDLEEARAISYWDLLRGGDREALAWLYDTYFDVLYNYGRKFGADGQALEDHIHDLYVDLWRYRASISPTSSVKFYLYRSLRRRLVNHRHAESGGRHERTANDEFEPSLEDAIVEREHLEHQSSQLESLLRQLPFRQYEAIVLRFYDNLEYGEIATILDINEQSARNLIQRGLAHLKLVARVTITWISAGIFFDF